MTGRVTRFASREEALVGVAYAIERGAAVPLIEPIGDGQYDVWVVEKYNRLPGPYPGFAPGVIWGFPVQDPPNGVQ